MEKVYFAARYDKGTADYINCPFTKEEYERFLDALTHCGSRPRQGVGSPAKSNPRTANLATLNLFIISRAACPSRRLRAAAATLYASAR